MGKSGDGVRPLMHRIHLIITGRVQGVFFRANTFDAAKKLKLTGWVRNLPSGGVEVIADGEKTQLEKLIEWCGHGPPMANVENVEVEWLAATGEFAEFGIKYM